MPITVRYDVNPQLAGPAAYYAGYAPQVAAKAKIEDDRRWQMALDALNRDRQLADRQAEQDWWKQQQQFSTDLGNKTYNIRQAAAAKDEADKLAWQAEQSRLERQLRRDLQDQNLSSDERRARNADLTKREEIQKEAQRYAAVLERQKILDKAQEEKWKAEEGTRRLAAEAQKSNLENLSLSRQWATEDRKAAQAQKGAQMLWNMGKGVVGGAVDLFNKVSNRDAKNEQGLMENARILAVEAAKAEGRAITPDDLLSALEALKKRKPASTPASSGLTGVAASLAVRMKQIQARRDDPTISGQEYEALTKELLQMREYIRGLKSQGNNVKLSGEQAKAVEDEY